MKSGFKDPIAPKKHEPKAMPKDGKNSPWQYNCPDYDQRSSCFVNTGTKYGVGHAQPVGHQSEPKMRVDTMPKGAKSIEMYENY
jgi:hypothetical protein